MIDEKIAFSFVGVKSKSLISKYLEFLTLFGFAPSNQTVQVKPSEVSNTPDLRVKLADFVTSYEATLL